MNETDLIDALERLSDQARCLTQAVDDLIIELQWRNNNVEGDDRSRTHSPLSVRVTSMPVDPTAKDWQINRYTPADVLPEEPETPTATPATQTSLFE